MNYTTNYHLPQWAETDRVLMQDFNEAMAGIESGITATKESAETAIATAQTTADAARTEAASAQATADAAYCPENKPYVIGRYGGTSSGPISVRFGFKPSAILVARISNPEKANYKVPLLQTEPTGDMTFVDGGFNTGSGSIFNSGPYTFGYIAFR